MAAGSAITSEMQLLDAGNPRGDWRVVQPRKSDVEYDISHRGDHLFILLRDAERQNSELLVAPVADPTNTKVSACIKQPCTTPLRLHIRITLLDDMIMFMHQCKMRMASRRLGRCEVCMFPVQVLLPHRKDVKLESVLACHNFLVVFHRTNGLQVQPPSFCTVNCACRLSGIHVNAPNFLLRFLCKSVKLGCAVEDNFFVLGRALVCTLWALKPLQC